MRAALGEPTRLAIVDRLLLGDGSPGQLGHEFGLPRNLLAHHVKLLEAAGVVERSCSEGDHRRTYLRLCPEALTGLVPTGWRAAPRFLPLLAERFARQRLQALAKVEGHHHDGKPTVLFLCVHNAGRSQMALGFFQHFAEDRAVAWSGGSEPGYEINPSAIAAMRERGIDISREFPKPWTDEIVGAADVVITMGCGDACPVFPGKRYLDWELDDRPA